MPGATWGGNACTSVRVVVRAGAGWRGREASRRGRSCRCAGGTGTSHVLVLCAPSVSQSANERTSEHIRLNPLRITLEH